MHCRTAPELSLDPSSRTSKALRPNAGQHLDLIAGLYDVPNRREKSDELLAFFDLTAKVNELASSLSRGMRQKLAICCNYLFDPKVLLLDEPLTGLDPPGIRCLLDSIRDRTARGACVILSSHLLAMKLQSVQARVRPHLSSHDGYHACRAGRCLLCRNSAESDRWFRANGLVWSAIARHSRLAGRASGTFTITVDDQCGRRAIECRGMARGLYIAACAAGVANRFSARYRSHLAAEVAADDTIS